MARTPFVGVRVPEDFERRVRESDPELLGSLDISTLIRAGLALLAGAADSAAAAVAMSKMRPGPRPRADRQAARSSRA